MDDKYRKQAGRSFPTGLAPASQVATYCALEVRPEAPGSFGKEELSLFQLFGSQNYRKLLAKTASQPWSFVNFGQETA